MTFPFIVTNKNNNNAELNNILSTQEIEVLLTLTKWQTIRISELTLKPLLIKLLCWTRNSIKLSSALVLFQYNSVCCLWRLPVQDIKGRDRMVFVNPTTYAIRDYHH